MSRSQFHSIKLFILRHAWLNLWDKHMTTGRINQVTVWTIGGNKFPPTHTTGQKGPAGWLCNWHDKKSHRWLDRVDSASWVTQGLTFWLFRHVSLHSTSDKATETREYLNSLYGLMKFSVCCKLSYGNTNKFDNNLDSMCTSDLQIFSIHMTTQRVTYTDSSSAIPAL
jgi:hypothetical protein